MKNKFLITVITVFATIFLWILYLNLFDSNNVNYRFFERKYNNTKVLTLVKLNKKMSNLNYIDNVPSNDSIIEMDKEPEGEDSLKCHFYCCDFNFKKIKIKQIILPKNCNVIFYNNNKTFYTRGFQFYSCDLSNNKISKYNLKNFKIASIKFLYNSKNEFIAFGEIKQKNMFNTGFFKIDLDNNTIVPIKIVDKNNESQFLTNTLKYAGDFSYFINERIFSYTCDKSAKIFFFNVQGIYIKEVTTNDNVPLPQILTNEKGDSFYGREGTWNTNTGIFLKNNFVYVFSSRSKEKYDLILDKYSYTTTKYIESFKIRCNEYSSRDITNMFFKNDLLIVTFTTDYASFKFSR
jgi:hypothetical protein